MMLAIESTCDDTALALVLPNGELVHQSLYTQDIHTAYGGVVPELAARDHAEHVLPMLQRLLATTNLKTSQLTSIAYTRGPGLMGGLLAGATFAHTLAYSLSIPVYGVHHLHGHIAIALKQVHQLQFPTLVLLLSGGHSVIWLMHSAKHLELLCTTIDDAVGEAFDKLARLLDLPYPGGPAIEKIGATGHANFTIPFPLKHEKSKMSLSGIKTHMIRLVQKLQSESAWDITAKKDIAASFEAGISAYICHKISPFIHEYKSTTLVAAGGVLANTKLRSSLQTLCKQNSMHLAIPPIQWCTDNAYMIALAAQSGVYSPEVHGHIHSLPRWDLAEILHSHA